MIVHVLTLFPDMFPPVLSESMLGKAQEKEALVLDILDIRDFALNKHKKSDDTPFGGGAGMVLNADPVFRALESIPGGPGRTLYLSPRGRILDQALIRELTGLEEMTLLCGRYEGVDQRILDYWEMEEVSIGDYVLTGGELPAMVLIDAVTRLLPEVLAGPESRWEESVYSGLLEYPHYTKPREYRGMEVPEVLLSGNHQSIRLWRLEQAVRLTRSRRPDLFEKFLDQSDQLEKDEKKMLQRILESSHE